MHYDRNSSAARTAASAALSAELRVPLGRLITSGGRSSTTNTSRRAVLRAPMTASYAGQLRPAVSVIFPHLKQPLSSQFGDRRSGTHSQQPCAKRIRSENDAHFSEEGGYLMPNPH